MHVLQPLRAKLKHETNMTRLRVLGNKFAVATIQMVMHNHKTVPAVSTYLIWIGRPTRLAAQYHARRLFKFMLVSVLLWAIYEPYPLNTRRSRVRGNSRRLGRKFIRIVLRAQVFRQ